MMPHWFRSSGVPRFRGAAGRFRVLWFLGSVLPVALLLVIYVGAARPESRAATSAPPNWASDIAPIIYANCSVCHRPGQSAPFSLLSYDDVQSRGEAIVDVTERRYMPPWQAARAKGFAELRDERRLKDSDIKALKEWVAAAMPVGNAAKAPQPPVFPVGWRLGVPDLVVSLPAPIAVPADGHDIYRNVTLSLDLPVDRAIIALDYEPSARAVVHHALFFVEPADVQVTDADLLPGLGRALLFGRGVGSGARLAAADEAWGGLGGWVPGTTPRFFPDGIAQPLPRHSNIVMQMHLHPSGREETEDGKLALYFARGLTPKSLTGVQVPPAFGYAAGLDIPAGDKRFVIQDAFTLPVAVEVYGARGHAHYLGREMKMTATLPDKSTRGLLWIDRWDFAWQDSYFFKTPVRLPKGTRLDVEIVYDNSAENPRNPNSPPMRVRWGRGSQGRDGQPDAARHGAVGGGQPRASRRPGAALSESSSRNGCGSDRELVIRYWLFVTGEPTKKQSITNNPITNNQYAYWAARSSERRDRIRLGPQADSARHVADRACGRRAVCRSRSRSRSALHLARQPMPHRNGSCSWSSPCARTSRLPFSNFQIATFPSFVL